LQHKSIKELRYKDYFDDTRKNLEAIFLKIKMLYDELDFNGERGWKAHSNLCNYIQVRVNVVYRETFPLEILMDFEPEEVDITKDEAVSQLKEVVNHLRHLHVILKFIEEYKSDLEMIISSKELTHSPLNKYVKMLIDEICLFYLNNINKLVLIPLLKFQGWMAMQIC
jgi:hypothetical protein